MKRIFLVFLLMSFVLQAQVNGSPSQYKINFSVYAGSSTMSDLVLNFANRFENTVDYSVRTPIGFKANYYVQSWLSVGVDYYNRSFGFDFEISDTNELSVLASDLGFDLEDSPNDFTGKYALNAFQNRIYLNATFHVLPQNNNSDLNVSVGFGPNLLKSRLTKDGADIDLYKKLPSISLPVAAKLSVEYRYYFASKFGVHANLSLGGPIVAGGLNFRL